MNPATWTLRISRSAEGLRVASRRRQFMVGRPVEFDPEAGTISALEYALGALGAEIAGGLLRFAKRRRLVIDDLEATVRGEIEHPLVYLEVVGETGRPRISAIHVKVFVTSAHPEAAVREAFAAALERMPLLATFQRASRVSVELACTM